MTTLIIFHEVDDGERWAVVWQRTAGSRHELFDQIGVKARTFRDPENPNSTGLILEVQTSSDCMPAWPPATQRDQGNKTASKLTTCGS